jgi:hypothetical protein
VVSEVFVQALGSDWVGGFCLSLGRVDDVAVHEGSHC